MSDYSKTLLQKKVSELSDLSIPGFDRLFESATLRQVSKKENILKQGQICNSVFFVEKGYLRTFMDKDGTDINIDFTFEGNFTTQLKSLRNSTPSEVTIQAGEKTLLYEFNKDRLFELYKASAEIESFGRKLLEQLLMDQEEHANLFKIYSPTERYHYFEVNKPELLQRVSLSQLASYLGIARETLSRIRKK